MLYDVILPGNGPGVVLCPQLQCPARYRNQEFSRREIDHWEAALQQGPAAARAFLNASEAPMTEHLPACPFRCLPPAVLALCGDDELLTQQQRVWAILDDC